MCVKVRLSSTRKLATVEHKKQSHLAHYRNGAWYFERNGRFVEVSTEVAMIIRNEVLNYYNGVISHEF